MYDLPLPRRKDENSVSITYQLIWLTKPGLQQAGHFVDRKIDYIRVGLPIRHWNADGGGVVVVASSGIGQVVGVFVGGKVCQCRKHHGPWDRFSQPAARFQSPSFPEISGHNSRNEAAELDLFTVVKARCNHALHWLRPAD